MAVPLRWEDKYALPRHIDHFQTANQQYDCIAAALIRLKAMCQGTPVEAVFVPLATGGAMAVYKLTVTLSDGRLHPLVCKIPHERQLVYTSGAERQVNTTHELLDHLVCLADHLTDRAPGLFPRSGGAWHWQTPDGVSCHLLIEEFIPGISIERMKYADEERWTNDQMSTEVYFQRRTAQERLAITTFVRLWDALDRRQFTSDPSPWNLLVPPHEDDTAMPQTATIIDLHSLEENVGLSYVTQRLAAVYGLRQEVLEQALLPGILDVLGQDEGRELLRAELPQLEAEAELAAQRLGVNLQQPLLNAIRAL
ncbi:MAG: hypothetical protein ETSY1_38105 [Candidatus Entotheonella factor]|uniref:Aminoglycoside phosphotransferase domain-containing protein n=1 Tax=Entotheonella factor TaxID=1429438 RepID=W4L7N8_ENTF1|nr:MAG: hypothetical protein ETSY1_38105 [Candidatus Entotheonella factor]